MKLRRYCELCKRLLTEERPGIKPYHAPMFFCDDNHRILHWQELSPEKRHRLAMCRHIPYVDVKKE